MDWLRNVHAILASLLLFFFIYQAATGVNLLGEVRAAKPGEPALNGWHRRSGPVLALLVPGIFVLGLLAATAGDSGYRDSMLHLVNGLLLLLFTTSAYLAARKIGENRSGGRQAIHMTLGVFSVLLFFAQAVIGVTILLGIRSI